MAEIVKLATPINDTADRLDGLTSALNILKVSEWLIGLGVLTKVDPHMLRRWHQVSTHTPLHPAADMATPADFAEQIIEHLEFAKAAMKHTNGLRTFMEALARAQDAAAVAVKAGYDQWPMPEAFNLVTRLIAFTLSALRQEIMRRILDGRIDPANAEAAWAVLNDPRWNDQCKANAAMGEAGLIN
jgi:hypothetical protein